MRKLLIVVLLFAVTIAVLAGCGGDDKSYPADRFDADLAVQPDGSLIVTETVDCRCFFVHHIRELDPPSKSLVSWPFTSRPIETGVFENG